MDAAESDTRQLSLLTDCAKLVAPARFLCFLAASAGEAMLLAAFGHGSGFGMMLLIGRDLVRACPAMLQLLLHSRILMAALVAFALNAFFDGMDATAHETANAVLASGHL